MSEQYEKVQIEKEILTRELQLLKTAMPPQKAAEKLIESMSTRGDPFQSAENEWITQAPGGGDGCCSVM